jgi:hypothetical protein
MNETKSGSSDSCWVEGSGGKPKSDDEYFERMTHVVFQAGMNWQTIQDKWTNFQEVFAHFSIEKVANFTEKDAERLIIKEGGASHVDVKLVDVDMPHHLAYFPLDEIKKIADKTVRDDLEEKWIKALDMLDKYGEEHPPVIAITCWK